MMKNFRIRADSDVRIGSSSSSNSSTVKTKNTSQSKRVQNEEESTLMRREGRSPSQYDGQASPKSTRRGMYEDENCRDRTKVSPVSMKGPSQRQDAFGGLHLLLAAAEQSLDLPCLDSVEETKTEKKAEKNQVRIPPYAISEDQDDKRMLIRHVSSTPRAKSSVLAVSPDSSQSPTNEHESIASAMLKTSPKCVYKHSARSSVMKVEEKTKPVSAKKNNKSRVMPPDSDTSTYAARRRRAGSKRPSEHRAEKEKQELQQKLRKIQEEKKKDVSPPLICLLNCSDSGSNDEFDNKKSESNSTSESRLSEMEDIRSSDLNVRYLKSGYHAEEREEAYGHQPVFRAPYQHGSSMSFDHMNGQGFRDQLPHHPTPSHSPGNRPSIVLKTSVLRRGAEEEGIGSSSYQSPRRILHVYPPPPYLQDLDFPAESSSMTSITTKPIYHVPVVTERHISSPRHDLASRSNHYPYHQVVDGQQQSVVHSHPDSSLYEEKHYRNSEYADSHLNEMRDGHAEIWRKGPSVHSSAATPVTPGYRDYSVVRQSQSYPQSLVASQSLPMLGEMHQETRTSDATLPFEPHGAEGQPSRRYKAVKMILIPHHNRSRPAYPPTSERHFPPSSSRSGAYLP